MKINKERKKERKKLCECGPLRPDGNTLAEIDGIMLPAFVTTKYSEVTLSRQPCQCGMNYRRFYAVSASVVMN